MLTHPHIRSDELAIASKLVTTILAAGHMISVHDGEEFPLKCSVNHDEIIAAMGSTDSDTLVIRAFNKLRVGTILLIYGNGEDLISDHCDNPATLALVEAVGAI